jgi:predicted nucleotidyltransferase
MFLLEVARALDRGRVSYAIIGGYAVALHGAVRGTVDIDIAVKATERTFIRTEQAMRSIGLESRLPVSASELFQSREDHIRDRDLTKWRFASPARASTVVDVILPVDLETIKIRRIRVHGQTVKLASLEDLIAIKKENGSRQDLEDVRALESLL